MKIVANISFVSEDGQQSINLRKTFKSDLVPTIGALFFDAGLVDDTSGLMDPRLIESVTLNMLDDTYEVKLKDYLLPLKNKDARAKNMQADLWEITSFLP